MATCQTQLKFQFSETGSEQGPKVEEFLFKGKRYLAVIAPRYGCRLTVRPDDRKTLPSKTKEAFLAFSQVHQDRIEMACRQAWAIDHGSHAG